MKRNTVNDMKQTIEIVEILKKLPEAQQAYLNGVAVGMATERKLANNRPTTQDETT